MNTYSIITINYNNKDGLEKTILSVINQSYKTFEYIIIDGGSQDGSIDIIKKYENHINYWVSEPDAGIYNAMNKGISHATGKYINFMNSGDTFHSMSVLKDILPSLQNDIIIGSYIIEGIKHPFLLKNDNISMLDMITESINHQATFIKGSLFDNSRYNENYKIISDWIFFIEKIINENCSISVTNDIIVDYDYNGISSNREIVMKERDYYLRQTLPPRIYKDYETLIQFRRSVFYDIVPIMNKTSYRFQILIKNIISRLIMIYNKTSRFLLKKRNR